MAKAKGDEAVLEAEASLPKHTEGSCCVGCLVDGGEEWWLRFSGYSKLFGWVVFGVRMEFLTRRGGRFS